MRIAGAILIIVGLLFTLTFFGAFIGIPLMLIGLVMVLVGGRRKTIITNVVQVSNTTGGRGDDMDRPPRAAPNQFSVGRNDEPEYLAPSSPPRRLSRPSSSVADRLAPTLSSDEPFHDIENEISEQAIGILRAAKADGYEVQYLRGDNLVVIRGRGEPPTRLYSNDHIRDFGRDHGYR